ncbi:MAG: BrnT family toxin, partial [Hellea sp.]|nr:BrnT family toxin [Hellea sp.]
RFVSVGMDAYQRLLVTVFTHRKDQIRIISSRKATRLERRRYEDK